MNFNKKQGYIGSERSYRPVSSLLLVMAIAGTGSQQVFAQQPQGSASEPVEEVVVTGSLLATGRGSTSPVTVIGSDSLIENPRPNLSGFFSANVPQHQLEDSNQSNTSRENRTRVQGVSLRGLGAENTLTLINGLRTPEYGESISIGWRFVPIDQVLPAIALQRMEILLDGGSAIYGTDAVAGVVNLVPDYGFDGVKVQLSGQRYPDASSQRNDTGAFLLGTSNERTSWLSAIEWQKWDHVIQSDLDIFDPSTAVVANSLQYREFAPGTGVGGLGGAAAGNRLMDPLCGKSDYMSGSVTTLAGGPACAVTNWGSGPAGNDQIVRQGNRNAFTFFTGVKHEFTDRLRMELSASYNQTDNDNPTSNSAVVPNTNASSNLAVGTQIPIPANNPGVIRNAQLDPAWASNTGTNRGFFLPQMNVNNPWEVLTNQINSTYQRLSGTLEYDLTDVWTVKASSVVGSSNVDRYEPSLIADRMRKALAGFGGAGCTGTVAGAGGCEFYNPFFNAREPGRGNSQELLEWMQPSRYTNFVSELTVNQVVLTGDSSDLFELPAGPVGVAVGYEYRVDSWYTDHDPLANAGGYQAQLGGPSRDYPLPFASKSRSNVVDAWFMELAIPVTDTLDVQAAVRNEKYSEAADFSTTNPKLGFNWSVTEDITVRGSWGTSFKAPSVEHTQQPNLLSTTFLTLGNIGLNAVNGPCPSPANVPTGCFIAGGIGQTRVIVALETSPNVNLQPMESDNWSLGFNWDLTDSLTVGMNYVDIKFENVIRNLRPVDALLGLPECGAGYSPDGLFPSNYFIASQRGQDIYTTWGGINAFPGNPAGYRFPMYLPSSNCFTLDAKGMPTKGFQSPINVSERHIQSLDFNLTYTLDTAFGRFSVSPNAAITLAWKERALPADPEIDYTGFRPTFGGGIQEYRANMPITWTNDGTHTIIFTPRYLSKLDNYLSGNPEDDFIYYDLNYLWAVNDEMRVTFFANNVFNQFPTMHQIANTGSGQYPRDGVILGASFEMSYAF